MGKRKSRLNWISYKKFHDIWFDACDPFTDKTEFMNTWLNPKSWAKDFKYDLVYDFCTEIWRLSELKCTDILNSVKPSQLCNEFCIPKSTVADWKANRRQPPDWVRLVLIKRYMLYNFDSSIRIGDRK